ncbi:Phenylpropionate dioxygenase and related ring-hydroxylating dioxygenase, large terminal subunit [Candidatus Burkholderia verschuerenii]|uniref:Phenylpropionate dioxygenase and related ring-hydroxylating dioxygenase, large terminal subunit n=1 Tax=Candidatus Burkholderia verschuerenii TaxID=242163 RepID=A0A0L0MA15_9BURK|nr:Phenylpropionate dioxygenase and related ring-hydroxylating dioxygenase, large terminal subunit [Candidatus Burkholderia verschuerenii]
MLDFNHVPYIHPKTFLPLMSKRTETGDPSPEHAVVPDTLVAQSFASRMPLKIQRFPWHDMVQRYGEGDEYHNLFLFPNVNFISVGGLVFLVQQFDPLAPNRTQVRFTLMTAKENRRIAALPAILRGHLRSEVDVLYEDLGHLEALQANLHDGSPRVRHGQYEQRLMSFARVYKQLLDGDTA